MERVEFGTNGVRGIVGEEMDSSLAHRMGLAIGTHLKRGDRVILGTDARTSGPMLRMALTAGLLATGVHVDDAGIVPSPALQLYTRDKKYDLGVIITASHNPPPDNGIKLVEPDGTEAGKVLENRIEDLYAKGEFRSSTWEEVGRAGFAADCASYYVDAVVAQVDAKAIRDAKLRIVVDPGGGAGCETAPALMEKLGVECVEVSCKFDGSFADRPSEPTPNNAGRCIVAVKSSKANLGVLQDGDADRAIFITEKGEYVWGDTSLALAALYELPRHKTRMMCTAVSSSTCVADAVKMAGGELVWTVVGSPVVAREMHRVGAVFGGEDNGGLMFTRHQVCRDGLMAMAFMLELIATTKKPLSELVAKIPRYALVKDKLHIRGDKNKLLVAYKEAAAKIPGVLSVDDRDGVKAYLANGWVLVRPSGTEPIFRIQSESTTEEAAKALAAPFKKVLEAVINA